MANVAFAPANFPSGPRNSSPSPFGFGFGLSTTAGASGWQSALTPGHTHPAFQQLASSIQQSTLSHRAHKRRHEPEDELESSRPASEARDDSMDRSPTPERPKRGPPKRAKVVVSAEHAKGEKAEKENKVPNSTEEGGVDVGVLLASLPPQSLLPLLSSLLKAHPSLKPTVLSLIPRPTLETAIQALAQSAKKLQEAYPYSNNSPSLPPISSLPSFGFGSGVYRPHSLGSSMAGSSWLSPSPSQSQNNSSHNNGGMRESYILSRLRPHVNEFVSACMSYIPYFSYIPTLSPSSSSENSHLTQDVHSTILRSQHKDKLHPTETYLFLAALTTHIISQPALTRSSLAPLLLSRLVQEWRAWVDRVDEIVNKEGGMFGSETVKGWEKGLDGFAEMKGLEGWDVFREIRDNWVVRVGWLVGRTMQHPMEEGL